MEVYHRVSGGLDHTMIEQIEALAAHRLGRFIEGDRHREVFRAT
jgi:hypothetical protein